MRLAVPTAFLYRVYCIRIVMVKSFQSPAFYYSPPVCFCTACADLRRSDSPYSRLWNTLGQTAAGSNFVELHSVLRQLSIQSRRRRFCRENLSLTLAERESIHIMEQLPASVEHLDGERATSSSYDSCLLALFRCRFSHSCPLCMLPTWLSTARRIRFTSRL